MNIATKKTPRFSLRVIVGTFLALTLLAAAWNFAPDYTEPQATEPQPAVPPTKRLPDCRDPQLKADAERTIQATITAGWWTSVEWSGSSPKVWVTSKFIEEHYGDSREEFEDFRYLSLTAVWLFWNCQREDFGHSGSSWDAIVIVYDDGSHLGMELGTYAPTPGVTWNTDDYAAAKRSIRSWQQSAP